MSSSKLDQYLDEIREELAGGTSQRALATLYGVSRSTLQHFIKTRITSAGFATWTPDGLGEGPDATELPVVEVDYSDEEEHYVYPLGDVHIGSPQHAADRWAEWLTYIEGTPNASLLGTGDFLNSAIKTSVSETYDENLAVWEARTKLTSDLKPLADAGRVDLLMPGNHEDRIYRAVGDCPIMATAQALDVNYFRVAGVVRYKVGSVEYTVFVKHGTGGGQVGARANRLAKQAQSLLADVYVSGHSHSQLVFPQDVFVVDVDKVVRKRQLFVSSGSFLNYEEYAAKMGLAPQKIGAPRIRLDGERHDVHVSI